jgi:hypothetical protein
VKEKITLLIPLKVVVKYSEIPKNLDYSAFKSESNTTTYRNKIP